MAGRGIGTRLREGVWEIPLRRYVALLLTLAVLGALGFVIRSLAHDDRSCAAGVVRPEGSDECVGVSATGYDWGRAPLRPVVRAIDRENRSVKGPYVTVALLEPFTATDADNLGDVLHELQGAYLAQYQANHLSNGTVPAIRLVLANPGATGAHWEHTVDQLEGMTEGKDRLRAVAGVGLSTAENKRAVAALTARGIAVIGTSITADNLANGQNGKDPFPGLARVAPTNTDEARALTSFAKVAADKAVLVHDQKADDPQNGDPYSLTLQRSFEKLLKGSPYAPWSFNPPDDRSQEGSTANDFEQITHLVCDTDAGTDTILFAGRHTQLRQFINALGERGCQKRKFTLLTGDEASYLTGDKDLDRDALNRNLTVRYTALAHPDAWIQSPPATGGSAADAQVLQELVREGRGDKVGPIGDVDLEDGQLIIAYDAMRLTYQGIRFAKGSKDLPTLEEVRNEWRLVKGTQQRVNGASGWICLDNHGNPYDKAVPIVELTPQGTARFVRIAWPEGKPPAKECLPPS